MKLATTTEDFDRYCDTYKERIDAVFDAGFRYIDVSFFSIKKSAELLGDNWEKNANELRNYGEKLGVKFVQSHSPAGAVFLDEKINEELLSHTIRSIEVCEILGVDRTVCHAGVGGEWEKEEFFKRNKEFYSLLFPVMEKTGVNVLVENSASVNVKSYYTNTGRDTKELVEYVNHPLFHICWDTGHANCEGGQYQELVTMGKDLYALHVNDNNGRADLHTIPFLGTINMDDVMTGLIDSGYKGYFTFEACGALRSSRARREYEKDIRLKEPSLVLQKEVEKFMYSVGKYVLESYGCFEE